MADRIRKVNEFLRHEIAECLKAQDFDGLVTVKAIETGRDMKSACVWISVLGNEEEVLDEIESNKKQIQRFINTKMQTKNVPRLSFKIDRSGEHAQRIEELIRNEES